MQYKVLKFIRELMGDAVERGLIDRNVARAKFLAKNFKKGRPLIDPLAEADATRFHKEVLGLPLCSFKVEALMLFSTGMRPEEMLAVRPPNLSLDGTPSVRIIGAVRRDARAVEEYTKSASSRRTVPLDACTAAVLRQWLEHKREKLQGLGITSMDKVPVVSDLTEVKTYNAFVKEWERFTRDHGFQGVRPYALRHTFATLNLAYGESVKTISAILGHASASYTLDLYVGYVPSLSTELSNRYVRRLTDE